MTQKPNKPMEARAIGAGLRKVQLDALHANGLTVIDTAAYQRLLDKVTAQGNSATLISQLEKSNQALHTKLAETQAALGEAERERDELRRAIAEWANTHQPMQCEECEALVSMTGVGESATTGTKAP